MELHINPIPVWVSSGSRVYSNLHSTLQDKICRSCMDGINYYFLFIIFFFLFWLVYPSWFNMTWNEPKLRTLIGILVNGQRKNKDKYSRDNRDLFEQSLRLPPLLVFDLLSQDWASLLRPCDLLYLSDNWANVNLLTCVVFCPFFACLLVMWPLLTNVTPLKHTGDDIGSSAECSSDDEDLEECETSHAGGLG